MRCTLCEMPVDPKICYIRFMEKIICGACLEKLTVKPMESKYEEMQKQVLTLRRKKRELKSKLEIADKTIKYLGLESKEGTEALIKKINRLEKLAKHQKAEITRLNKFLDETEDR